MTLVDICEINCLHYRMFRFITAIVFSLCKMSEMSTLSYKPLRQEYQTMQLG